VAEDRILRLVWRHPTTSFLKGGQDVHLAISSIIPIPRPKALSSANSVNDDNHREIWILLHLRKIQLTKGLTMEINSLRFMMFPWYEDEGIVFMLKELGFYVACG